jgi:regulator of RNase E activity RraA
MIQSGDLVHGDRNGVHTIPREIASEVPDMVRRIQEREGDLIRFCRSSVFSAAALSDRMRSVSQASLPPGSALTT